MRQLEEFKADKKACDEGIEEIIAATRIGKDRATAVARIVITEMGIAECKELIEPMAISKFKQVGDGKQLPLSGGAVVVRDQANVIIEDTDRALAYVQEKAPALVKLVPVNASSYKKHLREAAEKLDPEGVHEFVQVIYEPKVLYFKKKLALLLVKPALDEGEDNRISF